MSKLADNLKLIERLQEKREKAIAAVIRTTAELKRAQARQKRLYKKLVAEPTAAEVAAEAAAPIEPAPVTSAPATSEAAKPGDGLDIPAYLRRRVAPSAPVAAVLEQEERRKAKTRGRIATMKARQSGDTKKMPLSGRDAARLIAEQ